MSLMDKRPNFHRVAGSTVLPRLMVTLGVILGGTFSAFALIVLYMNGG